MGKVLKWNNFNHNLYPCFNLRYNRSKSWNSIRDATKLAILYFDINMIPGCTMFCAGIWESDNRIIESGRDECCYV